MTCIVGLEHGGNVYMGADSAGVSGLSLTVRSDEKLFRNGPFLIGFTSSFRMGQILQYEFEPPKHDRGMGDMEYLVTEVVSAIRETLFEGGYAIKRNERETGGTFLLGYRKRLYTIYDDFQVARSSIGCASVGCGSKYALGSMYTSKGRPESRVRTALQAANEFSAGVAPPYLIMKL